MSSETPSKRTRTCILVPAETLSQIDKSLLDFERDQKCLVTLARNNVYCCLICGKFLAGRAVGSPVAKHALLLGHLLFVHLHQCKYYIMPQSLEVDDPHSLDLLKDITRALRPRFTACDTYDTLTQALAADWQQKPYIPGYINLIPPALLLAVLIQVLAHTPELVNHFLVGDLSSAPDAPVAVAFARILQRLWSAHLLRPQVSIFPIEQLLPAATLPKPALLTIIAKLCAESKAARKVVGRAFRGKITIAKDGANASTQNFWMLSVDVPPTPLFGTGQKVPQVALTSLLEKYDGHSTFNTKYIIHTLPQNLFIHLDRGATHNPTVVSFPDALDMGPYTCGQKAAKYILSAVISQSSDKHWQVSVPRHSQWYRFDGNSVLPTQGDLLFMEEIHIMVWRKIDL